MDEIPGVEEYLTLLDKASEASAVPWAHDELFKEADDETAPVAPAEDV